MLSDQIRKMMDQVINWKTEIGDIAGQCGDQHPDRR